MAKKRGRPKGSTAKTQVAVLDDVGKDPSIYAPDYTGRRWWLLGIKVDEEREQLPFHNSAFGGVAWQQGAQQQTRDADGWVGAEGHRTRLGRQLLSSGQVKRVVREIKQKVIRWQRIRRDTPRGIVERWRADILSLEHRVKGYDEKDKKFVPGGYRFYPGPNDEPISKYLVFISRAYVVKLSDSGKFYEPSLRALPTMLDLDSSLIPDRMTAGQDDMAAGDEVW